jgi:prepilin-type N-terminal cleavage/methylation domain-containing protein
MDKMKNVGLRRMGGKKGLTLIELLIVMVILAILAGIVIISIGGVFGTAQERAYEGARDQIQVGVGDYMSRTYGDLPVTGNTTTIDGTDYQIIDVCILQMTYNGTAAGTDIGPGLLLEIPVSCAAGGNVSNCEGVACGAANHDDNGPEGACDTDAHYVWAVTPAGDVKSTVLDCTGIEDCVVATDNYQGIYP